MENKNMVATIKYFPFDDTAVQDLKFGMLAIKNKSLNCV